LNAYCLIRSINGSVTGDWQFAQSCFSEIYSHTNGVKGITYLAQTINPKIGSYQEHFINGNYDFTVKLSNGKIDMSIEIAQDYEAQPGSVTYDRYEIVADTFRKTE